MNRPWVAARSTRRGEQVTRRGGRHSLALLLAVPLLLVLLGAACGSEQEESSEATQRRRPTLPSLPRPSSSTTEAADPSESTSTSVPADGSEVDISDAVASLPESTFDVRYSVSGDPYLDYLEIWWKSPKARLDGSYAGYEFHNYLDGDTGEWTLCVTILGQYACDSDSVPELAGLSGRLEALAPSAAANRVLEMADGPDAVTEQRTIAGEPVACVVSGGQTGCLAGSGALMYSEGMITMSVNGSPEAGLVLEATEYSTEVSDEELTP